MTERDQEEQDWRIAMNTEEIVQKRINEIKLAVEAEKLQRDRMLEPWKVVIGAMAAGGGLFAGGAAALGLLLHLMGKL